MWLPQTIRVQNYCQFVDATFDLSMGGIITITGPQGGGKSNLLRALSLAFASERTPGANTFADDILDGASFAKVTVDFLYDHGVGQIVRTLERKSANSTSLKLTRTDGTVESYEKSGAALARLTELMGNEPSTINQVIIAHQQSIDEILLGTHKRRQGRMEDFFHGDTFAQHVEVLKEQKSLIQFSPHLQDEDAELQQIEVSVTSELATQKGYIASIKSNPTFIGRSDLKARISLTALLQSEHLAYKNAYDTIQECETSISKLESFISAIQEGTTTDLSELIASNEAQLLNYENYLKHADARAQYLKTKSELESTLAGLRALNDELTAKQTTLEQHRQYLDKQRYNALLSRISALVTLTNYQGNVTSSDISSHLRSVNTINAAWVTYDNQVATAEHAKEEVKILDSTILELNAKITQRNAATAYATYEKYLSDLATYDTAQKELAHNKQALADLHSQLALLNEHYGLIKVTIPLLSQVSAHNNCECPVCGNTQLPTNLSERLDAAREQQTTVLSNIEITKGKIVALNTTLASLQKITQPSEVLSVDKPSDYPERHDKPLPDIPGSTLDDQLRHVSALLLSKQHAAITPTPPASARIPHQVIDGLLELNTLAPSLESFTDLSDGKQYTGDLADLTAEVQSIGEVRGQINAVMRTLTSLPVVVEPSPVNPPTITRTELDEQRALQSTYLSNKAHLAQALQTLAATKAQLATTISNRDQRRDRVLADYKYDISQPVPETTAQDLADLANAENLELLLTSAEQNLSKLNGKYEMAKERRASLSLRIAENEAKRARIARIDSAIARLTLLPTQLIRIQLRRIATAMDGFIARFARTKPFKIVVTDTLGIELEYPSGARRPFLKASGGERIIISIAFRLAAHRHLAPNVPWLALDEPTNHLMAENIQILADLLQHISSNLPSYGLRMLLVTTHSNQLAQVGHNIPIRQH